MCFHLQFSVLDVFAFFVVLVVVVVFSLVFRCCCCFSIHFILGLNGSSVIEPVAATLIHMDFVSVVVIVCCDVDFVECEKIRRIFARSFNGRFYR